ncbi:MAG: hypothetical protein ACYDH8_08790 [Syntrophales bacterium]
MSWFTSTGKQTGNGVIAVRRAPAETGPYQGVVSKIETGIKRQKAKQ